MSNQEQLAVTYDMPPEFYKLWLDHRMNYSCALFEGTDDLEVAQVNKLRYMHDAAHITPDKRVLDIGCGWGGNIEYLSKDREVRDVTGITLSRAQFAYLETRRQPGLHIECTDYRTYQPKQRFDAVVSIGMFEHIATPEQARAGKHLAIYRDYFRKAWEWTTEGAWFSLQSVIGLKVPRDVQALREIGWATYSIFPGAIAPRLEAIMSSTLPYWEVVEVRTRREHYRKTSAAWLARLRGHEAVIRERWGDERFAAYQRYLDACVMAFEQGYQSLAQLSLRRLA